MAPAQVPGTLKEVFAFGCLARLVVLAANTPFSAEDIAHMADVVIVAAWFMLRDSALFKDLTATHVAIDVPLRKTALCDDTPTPRVCLRRTGPARCARSMRAQRHLLRLRLHAAAPEDPLLPAQDGGFLSKHAVIRKMRQVLRAAGVELTYLDTKARSGLRRQTHDWQEVEWGQHWSCARARARCTRRRQGGGHQQLCRLVHLQGAQQPDEARI